MRFPQPGSGRQALREGRRRKQYRHKTTGRARRARCAPQYAGGGRGSRWPYLSEAPADPGRDRCTLHRNAHDDGVGPPCADSSPTPARALGESAARNAARPQYGQPPSSTLHESRPEPRKGGAGIRNPRHSAFRPSWYAHRLQSGFSQDGRGADRNAPPGHSAGASECGAAWTAPQDCRRS